MFLRSLSNDILLIFKQPYRSSSYSHMHFLHGSRGNLCIDIICLLMAIVGYNMLLNLFFGRLNVLSASDVGKVQPCQKRFQGVFTMMKHHTRTTPSLSLLAFMLSTP